MMHGADGPSMLAPRLLVVLVAGGYLWLAWRQRQRPRGWSAWRTAGFIAGSALLMLGLVPQWLPFPAGDFRKHMLQHLLLGMLAPLGLVMAAPITLVLRSVPARLGRGISRGLRSRYMQVVANPISALVLDLGGMALLYFSPLYMAMMTDPALHYLVHLHFVLAGCLYTWVIAGPDPAPHRPSVPARLVVLGAAVLVHSVLAQLLYAGWFVQVPAPAGQLQQAAELMYYGGDIVEMLLAIALVSTWRPTRMRVAVPGGRKVA
jgi:putative membrane protein